MPRIALTVVRSTCVRDALSLRVRGGETSPDALDLRAALKSAGFHPGQPVVLMSQAEEEAELAEAFERGARTGVEDGFQGTRRGTALVPNAATAQVLGGRVWVMDMETGVIQEAA